MFPQILETLPSDPELQDHHGHKTEKRAILDLQVQLFRTCRFEHVEYPGLSSLFFPACKYLYPVQVTTKPRKFIGIYCHDLLASLSIQYGICL